MKRLAVFFLLFPVLLSAQVQQPVVEFAEPAAGASSAFQDAEISLTMEDLQPLEAQSAEEDLLALNTLAQALTQEPATAHASADYARKWTQWQELLQHLQQGSQYTPEVEAKLSPEPPRPTTEALEQFYQQRSLELDFQRNEERATLQQEIELKRLRQEQLALNQPKTDSASKRKSAVGGGENNVDDFEEDSRSYRDYDHSYYLIYDDPNRGNYSSGHIPYNDPARDNKPHSAKPTNFLKLRDIHSYSRLGINEPCAPPKVVVKK